MYVHNRYFQNNNFKKCFQNNNFKKYFIVYNVYIIYKEDYYYENLP